MSLANFLPPLCDVDPKDNTCHYLVDGGYVNTVPVDVMKYRFGAKVVIAVDVSGEWSLQATHNYGDFLSGASVLLSKWNPFSKEAQNVPSMSDIATQIAYVSACRQIQRVKGVADLYIVPPISQYSVLDFGHFEEIKQVGLDFGRQSIDKWLESLPAKKKGQYGWLSPPSKSNQSGEVERNDTKPAPKLVVV
ncbi:sws [Symbiodinium microadriaticum]|nr:sws [Symbiodinium microadriaticum]